MALRRPRLLPLCLAGTFPAALAGALASALTRASVATAQVPADLAPADATAFVGWRGMADPGTAFTGSKWQAVLKDSQAGRFVDETLPAIGVALERRFPQQGQSLHAGVSVLRQAIRKPAGVYLAFSGESPYGGFVCRAGAETKELTQLLQQLAAQLPPEASAKVVATDDAVALTVGRVSDAVVAEHLDKSAAYAAGIKDGVADPFFAAFVNVKEAVAHGEAALAGNAPPEIADVAAKAIDASGIAGISAVTGTAGFDNGDWRTDAFLAAPAPRKGLLDVKPPAALDADLAKRVPASANTYTMFAFDAHEALQTLRTVASDTDPRARDGLDKAIGAMTLAVGKNVEDDLLASFGPQWAAYTSPEIGGSSLAGVVLVNKLANPLKGKQAMTAVSLAASNFSRALVPDKTMTVAGRTTRIGNLNVFYTATPLYSPAWAVQDGFIYFGLYPQTVAAAAQFASKAVPEVQDARAALGLAKDVGLMSLSVTDPRASLEQGYGLLLAAGRLVLGASDMYLTPTPEPIVPSLAAFTANTGVVRSATWTDEAGWHCRSVSPYPGAATLADSSVGTLVGGAGLGTSILLPSLNRAREAANRVKSASNLRQIGLAGMMYANEHRDTLPADVGELFTSEDLSADVLKNPRSSEAGTPPPPREAAKEDQAAWATAQGDYVYVAGGQNLSKMHNAAAIIVAYENPKGVEDGINVLFADGHVDFVEFARMAQVFKDGGTPEPQR